jgi:hypothetical protein
MAPRGEATPVKEMESEFSGAYRRDSSASTWKLISAILAIILAGGAIISTMGKAFYVTRTEYTEKSQEDAVRQAYIQETLEQVKRSLTDQKTAFSVLSDTVQGLKIELVRHNR